MSNVRQVAKKLTDKKRDHLSKWDEAIAHASKKIAGLRTSISIYEVRKAAGDSWPGELWRQSATGY